MTDCIFCKIIAGDIPARKVYEDDQVLAFLDIQPVSPGHLLIIPKEHSDSVADMSDDQLQHVFRATRRLGRVVERELGAQGFNIIVNKGPAAGQLVFHTHIHLIPRTDGDGLAHWPKIAITDDDLGLIAEKLQTGLSAQ
ncbi:MAG: HIT family protein [Patescibacteria group bacterium]